DMLVSRYHLWSVTIRSADLDAVVRVQRFVYRIPPARQGPAPRVDGDRSRARAPRTGGRQQVIWENIFFGVIAAAMAISALGVVTTKNVVHAALFLVVVLAGGAAQFLLLGQEFVAWVQ